MKAVALAKYPELEKNPANPFTYLDEERRMQEIVSFCAQLWARTCQDRMRRPPLKFPAASEKRAQAA